MAIGWLLIFAVLYVLMGVISLLGMQSVVAASPVRNHLGIRRGRKAGLNKGNFLKVCTFFFIIITYVFTRVEWKTLCECCGRNVLQAGYF